MFATHHDVGAAVGLSRYYGNLGHSGLGVGEDQLGAVADDSAVLLVNAGHESGYIHQGHYWNVETVAEPDEPGRLGRRVDIQHSSQILRLIANQPYRSPIHPGEPNHHVGGKVLVHFHELFIVDDLVDDLPHVVGTVGIIGHQVTQVWFPPGCRVVGLLLWGILQVVTRQETQQMPHLVDAFFFSFVDELGHAAAGGMGRCPAQVFVGYLFTSNRLDHVGAGDIHLAGALNHEHEIGDGWRVDRAAG